MPTRTQSAPRPQTRSASRLRGMDRLRAAFRKQPYDVATACRAIDRIAGDDGKAWADSKTAAKRWRGITDLLSSRWGASPDVARHGLSRVLVVPPYALPALDHAKGHAAIHDMLQTHRGDPTVVAPGLAALACTADAFPHGEHAKSSFDDAYRATWSAMDRHAESTTVLAAGLEALPRLLGAAPAARRTVDIEYFLDAIYGTVHKPPRWRALQPDLDGPRMRGIARLMDRFGDQTAPRLAGRGEIAAALLRLREPSNPLAKTDALIVRDMLRRLRPRRMTEEVRAYRRLIRSELIVGRGLEHALEATASGDRCDVWRQVRAAVAAPRGETDSLRLAIATCRKDRLPLLAWVERRGTYEALQPGPDGRTAWEIAVASGNHAAVGILAAAGLRADADTLGECGNTYRSARAAHLRARRANATTVADASGLDLDAASVIADMLGHGVGLGSALDEQRHRAVSARRRR